MFQYYYYIKYFISGYRMKELWDESMKAMVNTQNPLFEKNKKYYDNTIHRETLVK